MFLQVSSFGFFEVEFHKVVSSLASLQSNQTRQCLKQKMSPMKLSKDSQPDSKKVFTMFKKVQRIKKKLINMQKCACIHTLPLLC